MNSPEPQSDPNDTPSSSQPNPAQDPGQDSPADGAVNLSEQQMVQFVTSIKNPVQQMGEHVLGALQQPNTVAVLTTVVTGPGGEKHIVSAALNPEQVAQVNALLQSASTEREDEEICMGFHCMVKPKVAPGSDS
ncbi:MAG: hypothetical protein AAF483_13210 [Planctomycetota bacterium]